jgi:hypothetical protein
MKKYLIYLMISFILPITVISQNFVSEEDAGKVAINFYHERIQSQRAVTFEQEKIASSTLINKENQPLYYVFNISTGGFVAISAFDGVFPVLCYSFSGDYSLENQPENFKAWMGQYERQISYAISTSAGPDEKAISIWDYYLDPVNRSKPFAGREVLPMLTSNWDQGTYYNAMCPADAAGPSGHCVTGCVATTLGQLLNYFRWPESGTGSYSYDCPPYGTLSVDYSSANYNYDLMENAVEHDNQEVAELLYDLGVSVDMVYGPDGSGMYNHKAAYTLKTYFKFSPETQYVFRDSTTMDWDSLIISHLDRNIPLYYAGWSVPNVNGHAFVCDGYQGENFYHFNWGWSGSNDGYFYTDNLSPGGNNFNLAQELVINAVPDTNLYDYPVHCQGDKEFEALYGTIDDGSGPLYGYANGSDCNWLITPNDSVNGITLNFHRFETEPGDYLTVYDGSDTGAPVLGTFTGQDLPDPVTTSGGSMLIHFSSSQDTAAGGFLASFESEIPSYCSGMVMLSEQTDTLTDGSGNWNYHDNTACLWRILPPGASSVTLYFTEFETENETDILTIYDLQTQEVLAEYSGTYESGVPEPVTSPSGKMFLSFSTNSTNTAPGWTAYYESNLVGIEEPVNLNNLLIFPNPAKEQIIIMSRTEESSIFYLKISDLSGRTVFTSLPGQIFEKSIRVDLSNFLPGIYILAARTSNGNTEFHKIVKD